MCHMYNISSIEEFEDIKRGNQNQYMEEEQKKRDERTNTDLQNIHIKLKIE